jgi:20S proteasome subunit beta 5
MATMMDAFSFLDDYSGQSKKNDVHDMDHVLQSNNLDFLALPPIDRPADFSRHVLHEDGPDAAALKFAHGTTTLAFVFEHGVMVAVDSRSSMGNYIASQTVKKIIEINPYLVGTMAGGAADCSFWERNLGRQCRLHELRNKERISVAAASKLLANMIYGYKGMGLAMGTMVSGWDKTGPHLYYVDDQGTRLKGQRFSVGSGSTYAYGILDTGYRHDLSVDEAHDLAKKSIYHATFRDGASGGRVSVYHIREDGWKVLSITDVKDLHEYKETPAC